MPEMIDYPFEFSVVMAVYNVEPFLKEAVESLIVQDFGFEKIQLIMVDDGSTDGSGAICDEYAGQYPENITVIHKENGGVSSARNEGLKYVQGRFVNFLDSDDKLGSRVMSVVHKFFRNHEEETDVVTIPMFFFDGASGAHRQNAKFQKGSRVINLLQDWKTVQLSCSSAFIKAEAACGMHFDPELAYCEDGKEILKILVRKMTLGVARGNSYYYRKRTVGAASAIQSSENNIKWYMPYLKGFTASILSFCQEEMGYIPKFIQFSLMYDLQWRVKQEYIPDTVMAEDDISAYKTLLFSLLKYFDDDVIMAQKDIQVEHKAFILKKKYGKDADRMWGRNTALLHYQNTCICYLNTNKTHLNFISITSDAIRLEGYIVLIAEDYGDVQIYLEVNGEKVPCVPVDRGIDRTALNEPIYFAYGFQCEVPIDPTVEKYVISLFCEVDGRRINRNRLVYGKYCPVSTRYRHSYYYHEGYVLTAAQSRLVVQKCGRKGRLQREYAYLRELWKRNDGGGRKAVFARLLTFVFSLFQHKKIWLISDRVSQADDNGEAFFQYVGKNLHKDVKVYFAVSPESPDYQRLQKYGKVIPFLGKQYKTLYLLADCIISSQAEEYIFHPFQKYSEFYRDLSQSQKFVFLQHGVIKDDLSEWLNRFNKNMAMFVVTTMPEYESILSGNYYYTDAVVKLTGLPRYDRLYRQEKRQIAIMPTWRAYLVTGIDPGTGKRELKPGYCESRYFAMYHELLNCQRLFDCAQELGYTIAFMHHPNMICAKDSMSSDHRLQLLEQNIAYRTVFAESDLLVTDYSSVAFDFAYLRKPVIYYQTDKEEFFSGAHTYEKGYFDYERDGFGEIECSVEALVDRIIEYMKNGCELKEVYRERIDATFPFSDQNNCKRVYEEILKLS